MAETLEAKAANDKRLAGILERIAKDRKAYEPLISTPEERSILRELGARLGQIHDRRSGRHRVVASEHRPDSA